MIAFLGTGLLGSNFVKALLRNGNQVNVWNRTTARAQPLEALGAHVFEHAADAVRGTTRVHLVVKDDAAVDEVLAAASAGFAPGTLIVDHTTTSSEGARARTQQWKDAGFTYLHAPVFMGPQNAHDSTGVMLVSGDQEVIAGILPALEQMTGKVLNLGDETGRAAGIKLLGNLFLIAMTGGLTDMLALAEAEHIPAQAIADLFAIWNPGAMLPMRLAKMTSNTFDQPSWELNMARKDARLMMEGAAKGGNDLI
ncbi:MAG: NAD(P)-dependent oxidoreductase, partial [Chitinophagia bacterium]|nr:NAD(P)-dependent oxidoreductase [Chitinophagia bacterium]